MFPTKNLVSRKKLGGLGWMAGFRTSDPPQRLTPNLIPQRMGEATNLIYISMDSDDNDGRSRKARDPLLAL
jgi:hypothetical protein